MPAETWRLFFALWPTPALGARLADLAKDGASRGQGRATRTDTLHLTLHFLGDWPVDALPPLQAAAAQVQAPAARFDLDCTGYWPHNRLYWAGCQQTPPALEALVGNLRRALKEAGLALGPEGRRRFTPHVTLARRLRDNPGGAILPAPLAWDYNAFCLVRSHLATTGARYETLGHWPLSQPA